MDDGEHAVEDTAEADALRAKGRAINLRAAGLALFGAALVMALSAL